MRIKLSSRVAGALFGACLSLCAFLATPQTGHADAGAIGPAVARGSARPALGTAQAAVADKAATAANAPTSRRLAPALPEQTLEAAGPADDGIVTADDGRIQVFVELTGPPSAVRYAAELANKAVSKAAAKNNAAAASRSQAQLNRTAQVQLAARLQAFNTREVYRVGRVLNGISVMAARADLTAIAAIAGVKRVIPILREHTTSSQSVPFIGAPNVWANTVGLPAGADGTGIRIGIIDTGIDYLHADLGGSGLLADYQTESTNSASFTTAGSFPTAKVVGGVDLAGDAYTGGNTPVPDANPMDCNGHGSHVSGTAAGFGVTSAGATFAGPYDANAATYAPLRIAPGAAPKALLYGIRVFGCTGSTGLTVQGIDWAMDPNGDDDLSDHLDVINMSLGSAFGTEISASALAADNAALAGVIVAVAAGNDGDSFFIAGSPGVASRAIATAASLDGGEPVGSVAVNSPPAIAGSYVASIPVYGPAAGGQTGTAVLALDAANATGPLTTDACTALTNAAAIAGNICVADRGTCTIKSKTLNCQNAGAIGMILVDNAPGSPPAGTGDDTTITTPITIPTLRMTLHDGNALKAALPANVTLNAQPGGDTMASFSSRGPRSTIGSPLRAKPDIAAPGLNITSIQTGHTCLVATGCTGVSDPSGFDAGNQALVISGTSMATPHMAGVMALLRQLKPDWTVEELKALAMNYAINDVTQFPGGTAPRYGASRAGSGRVDPSRAAVGDVIAMNADDVGLVSVTFEPEVIGTVTQVKHVRLVNHGSTAQTFDTGVDDVVLAPGVSFSLPGGNSVTVPASGSVELDVQMSANAAAMKHVRDPSLGATQGVQANYGDLPRNFLTERSAYLTFSQSATLKFRLPLYMAEKPASTMVAAGAIVTGGAPTGSTTIALSGTALCTGTLGAGPNCTGSFPTDIESLVSPFELQAVSPRNPALPDYADVQYAGAAYVQAGGTPSISNDLVMFGVASWGDWPTLNSVSYNICVDNNLDGTYDKIVTNITPSIFVSGASANDTFVRGVNDTATNGFSILGAGSYVNLVGPDVIDTALHANNVMILGASPSQLGISSTATTSIRYKIVTCPVGNPTCARTTTGDHCSPAAGSFYDQAAGPFFYNWGAQGLNFGGTFLADDLNGATLPVTWNTANLATNGSLGALLLHHQNKAGTRAQVVLLDTASAADLAITAGASSPIPALGSSVTVTLVASNNGPASASNAVVSAPLPDGLTYVSDDGGGAYNSASGSWTIASLANGASATLHIQASVASTDAQTMRAQIASSTPLDTNPANNQSSFTISAPRSSDLVLAMSGSVTTAHPGDPIGLTLTLTNNGVDPAYSVNVADSFPAYPGLAPTSATPSQGTFDLASKTWNLAGLGNGASATLVIGLAAPDIAGSLQNSATAASTVADPNAINNTAMQSIAISSPAMVSGALSNDGPTAIGSTVTYTLVLSNTGAFDQQDNPGAEMTDVLPSTLTLVNATATSGTAVASTGTNTVTWNGPIPAGGNVTVTITATVGASATVGTPISNTANIAFDADGDGTNEASVSASVDLLPLSPAQVTASETVSGSFQAGGAIVYSVVLSNNGSAAQLDNPGHEFVDMLPAGLTLVSAAATSGNAVATLASRTVTWDGAIPAGGSVTITIDASIDAGTPAGPISNQGTVNYDADGDGSNESSGLTDDPGLPGTADPTVFSVASPATLTASKTVSGVFEPLHPVTYTIVISNAGAGLQQDNPGDEFVDVLPPTLSLVSASGTSGTTLATNGTNTVTWNGSVPAGGSVTVTILATVNGAAGHTVSNQGTLHYDADGNGSNESTALTNDPAQPGTDNATRFVIRGAVVAVPVPALDLFALLLLAVGVGLLAALRRSRLQR